VSGYWNPIEKYNTRSERKNQRLWTGGLNMLSTFLIYTGDGIKGTNSMFYIHTFILSYK
jgi:hypothetical protein